MSAPQLHGAPHRAGIAPLQGAPRRSGIAPLQGAPRRSGIALLMALLVVLLLTFFLSELFFATGLEMRSLQAFRDGQQARLLARSALRALELALLQDELDFYSGLTQLQTLVALAGLPLEQGRIVQLEVTPLDALYNLNEIYNIKPGAPLDLLRWELFQKIMGEVTVPQQDPEALPAPLPADQVADFYAALFDWMDTDAVEYTSPAGARGAEQGAYFGGDPELNVKNGMLDRLEEMRLVRGFADLKVPWREMETRFTALPKSTGTDLYPERINVNLASRDEIVRYLNQRKMSQPTLLRDPTLQDVQSAVNQYADKADDIADALVPAEGDRPKLTDATLRQLLRNKGLNDNTARQVFITAGKFYRVRLTADVGGIMARLDATLQVLRKDDRTGTAVDVLQYAMN